ncbi:MAG: amino acid ABC transporter substrate-binding protein [Alphaproteobacteria bacterium]|nr:amino acid ABC transporter substrate-binding protein [Alphaproteobacteria bacterium]
MLALVVVIGTDLPAGAADPMTIGFDISLTGGLAANGKAALLATQIWAEDINAKGGLIGRPVKLLYYDDQSNPALVPGILTKLLDVDKVDLLLGGNGTNLVAPGLPLAIDRKLMFLSLFALDVNSEFHYDRYFSMIPSGGEHPKEGFLAPYFALAGRLTPKPRTLALTGADAEFSKNAMEGTRSLAKRAGIEIIYDKAYPPATIDFTPIARAISAANADLVVVCSYPTDTVGMIRAVHEVGLKARMFGGGMVGLQTTAFKTQLGPLMNGIVNYDFWLPWAHFASEEAKSFLKTYQAKSPEQQIDQLGYYLPPFAFARMQVLQQAVEATKSLDSGQLADYLRTHSFDTVVGTVKFGPTGEWAEMRVLEVQFQGVQGNAIDQFRTPDTEAILYPDAEKTGTLREPYQDAQH